MRAPRDALAQRDQRQSYNFLNFNKDPIIVNVLALQICPKLFQSPFGALADYIFILVIPWFIVLVDAAISQMHILVLNVFETELVGTEPAKAFFVDIYC